MHKMCLQSKTRCFVWLDADNLQRYLTGFPAELGTIIPTYVEDLSQQYLQKFAVYHFMPASSVHAAHMQ